MIDAKRLQEIDSTKLEFIPRSIYVVGCGGTGSAIVPSLLRLRAESIAIGGKGFGITLVDGDFVEEKNLLRQNFCRDDLHKNKAKALAERYGDAFGKEIRTIEKKIIDAKDIVAGMNDLVIGCVDNHKARVIMSEYCARNGAIYIDSGNELENGQIFIQGIFQQRINFSLKQAAIDTGLCVYRDTEVFGAFFVLDDIETNLLAAHPNIKRLAEEPEQRVSCAERQVANEQSFAINHTAATYLAQIVSRFVRKQPVNIYELQFDTECGVDREFACDYKKTVAALAPPSPTPFDELLSETTA